MAQKSLLSDLIGNEKTFTAYQKRGYEFNIIMSLDKNVRPWLLTKYCNCLSGKNERSKFDFVIDGGEWFANEDLFIIDIIRARKDLNFLLQKNLLNIIKNRLKNGIYVYGYFDEYYIKNKSAYNSYHFKHSFLIYRYDEENTVFYAIGYTNKLKFEKYTIPYEDFMIALTSLEKIELTFVCVNPDFDFSPKIESIYNGLYDYVHSIHSNGTYEPKVIYGIDTLNEFARYVQQTVDAQKKLDMRYSKFFMEFKSFMLERLDYLCKNGYIGIMIEEYSEVCKVFQIIHMLFIKYNITRDAVISERIITMIEDITNKERKIMLSALSQLKNALLEQDNINYV